jgi:hypothetical protein
MKSLTRILFTAALFLFINKSFADTQDRHLTGFTAIQLSSAFDVYLTQSNVESVKVEAPGDVIDRVLTTVQNGVLKIYDKNEHGWGNWSWGNKKMRLYVSARDINSISVSGSGDVYFKEGLNTNSLRLHLSGSGDLQGSITVKNLEAIVSGSGDVKLSGRAEIATASVSGSGDYTARNLATISTAVRVSGSGDATVNASQKLDAIVSGSGDISYTGGAKQVSTSSHGSGDIHRL